MKISNLTKKFENCQNQILKKCYDKFSHRVEIKISWSKKISIFAKSRHESNISLSVF